MDDDVDAAASAAVLDLNILFLSGARVMCLLDAFEMVEWSHLSGFRCPNMMTQ